MGEVIQLYSEEPLDFLKRNGPTITAGIAHRYGITVDLARRWMAKLKKDGRVVCRAVAVPSGVALEWIAVEMMTRG